jgi:hypothetical protein
MRISEEERGTEATFEETMPGNFTKFMLYTKP